MIALDVLAWAAALILTIPLLTLTVECLAALIGFPKVKPSPVDPRPRVAVLIPAHNEARGIEATLRAVSEQLAPGDRMLVVADNCTDDTAEVVRRHRAEVTERTNPVLRGKGFALAHGRDALAADPPEVVIVVDADCSVGSDAITRLAVAARTRPAQAAYTMDAPDGSGPTRRIAAFAFLVKNVVRPLGLRHLGGHCLLTGTGMAFPWAVFRTAPLADGHIVEDMHLTIDLAFAGHVPTFEPTAEVSSVFPTDDGGTRSQRRRWEHGHLKIITRVMPELFARSIVRPRLQMFAMALDLAVPPLSALVILATTALTLLTTWPLVGGDGRPAVILGTAFGLSAAALAGVWWRFGRAVVSAVDLLVIPLYAVRKLGLYAGFLLRPQAAWVRTHRANDVESSP